MSNALSIAEFVFPEDWAIVGTQDILRNCPGAMKIGPFGSQLKRESFVAKGYKVYGQENVFCNDFEMGERYIQPSHFQNLRSCEIKPGDFLISMMGTVGRCAVAPADLEPGIMDSHLLRIQIDEAKFAKSFLSYLVLDVSDVLHSY